MAALLETAELVDVNVDHLTGIGALVPSDRHGRLKRLQPLVFLDRQHDDGPSVLLHSSIGSNPLWPLLPIMQRNATERTRERGSGMALGQ